jgi:hypothetical protein
MRVRDNPDRDFSADPVNTPAAAELPDLLEGSEIADMLDPVIRQRFGELIAKAGVRPRRGP